MHKFTWCHFKLSDLTLQHLIVIINVHIFQIHNGSVIVGMLNEA
jgi:hypothetical protein